MTLEEAKILAENGNADVMMALVDYYSDVLTKDKDNEEASDLLSEYLERAAEAGHPDAILKMAQSSHKLADIMITMISNHGRDNSWEDAMVSAHKWTLTLVNMLDDMKVHDESKQTAYDIYIDSVVWLSTVYLLDENWNGIIRITNNVSSPIAKALYGLALFEVSETNSQIESAFSFLKNAIHPSFLSDRYSTPKLVEALRVDTCSILSKLYRTFYKDLDSAYNVLSVAFQSTKDIEMRRDLQEDMSHYRKTLFGSYKYIG